MQGVLRRKIEDNIDIDPDDSVVIISLIFRIQSTSVLYLSHVHLIEMQVVHKLN